MSKMKKRNEYAAQAAEPDFASMTDQEILEYVEAHPFNTISQKNYECAATRYGAALINSLPPEQQQALALELNSLAGKPDADLKAVYRRYFPHLPQFVL